MAFTAVLHHYQPVSSCRPQVPARGSGRTCPLAGIGSWRLSRHVMGRSRDCRHARRTRLESFHLRGRQRPFGLSAAYDPGQHENEHCAFSVHVPSFENRQTNGTLQRIPCGACSIDLDGLHQQMVGDLGRWFRFFRTAFPRPRQAGSGLVGGGASALRPAVQTERRSCSQLFGVPALWSPREPQPPGHAGATPSPAGGERDASTAARAPPECPGPPPEAAGPRPRGRTT